jgi:hypothetical protein
VHALREAVMTALVHSMFHRDITEKKKEARERDEPLAVKRDK